jgi:asparagine synthase (glutamine-hydrolysing)
LDEAQNCTAEQMKMFLTRLGFDSKAVITGDITQSTQMGERQKVFTASYLNSPIDESKWARLVVDKTKTSWYQTYPTADEFLSDLEDLVYTQDIPFGSTSMYAQYRVMKLGRENGIKVLLDGQGGDELFAGYAPYYRAFFVEILRNFGITTLLSELRYLKNSPVNLQALFVSLIRLCASSFLSKNMNRLVFNNIVNENKYISRNLWEEHNVRLGRIRELTVASLNDMLQKGMREQSLKTLLRYEDRNSMRFSIEARMPFADDINLIEYIFKVPAVYKIHNGWSKYLLRQSMAGILPVEIKQRKDKVGFSTPEYYWLNSFKDELKKYISGRLEGFIDVERLLRDWDTLFKKQPRAGTTNIWRFINLGVWMKVYNL